MVLWGPEEVRWRSDDSQKRVKSQSFLSLTLVDLNLVVSFNNFQMNVIGLNWPNFSQAVSSPGAFSYSHVSKSPKSIKKKKIDPVILSQSLTQKTNIKNVQTIFTSTVHIHLAFVSKPKIQDTFVIRRVEVEEKTHICDCFFSCIHTSCLWKRNPQKCLNFFISTGCPKKKVD